MLNLRPQLSVVASTVPANGDVNPYGVARVLRSTGLGLDPDADVLCVADSLNNRMAGLHRP